MNFDEMLANRTDFATHVIMDYFPKAGEYDKDILEAMNYSLLAGGKRLRPVMMYSMYKAFNGTEDVVYPFMAAMEMLHTYSLVHDDLPAIDNDDYRRGQYTTHKRYGEAKAVLAGDGLLHLAYETAIKAFDMSDSYENVINAIKIFGSKTGLYGMFGGQAADVINTGMQIDNELIHYIYENKTGALIEGSLMIGAALAKADADTLEKVCRIGSDIGMAFQIRDDILDIYGDEKLIGKPVLSDEKNNKKTYVSVYGIDKSTADIKMYTKEAVEILKEIVNDSEDRSFLEELFRNLTSRNK